MIAWTRCAVCSYWCHCFYCLTLLKLGFSALPSCQGLLFIAPFTNVVGGGKGVAKGTFYFHYSASLFQSGVDSGISSTRLFDIFHFLGQILKWSAITHSDNEKGLFVPMTGSVWQFWQHALLWKCGLIRGRRCTAHDNRVKWGVNDRAANQIPM